LALPNQTIQKEERKMKKLLAITVAAAILAMAGAALAADSNNLTVQASVLGTCKFVSSTSTLDFGSLDPSVGTNVNGSTTTTFWCTKGVTSDVITAGNGNNYAGGKRQMIDSVSSDVIPYTLTLTPAGVNAGPTSPRTLTIGGQVLGTDYTAKSAGSYSDTVVLNITP
jgi:spore coat protein U-like protein